jgi:putative ABC transport system permease protein
MILEVIPLAETRYLGMDSERFALTVLKVLSVIALFLTVVGFFSVLAYTVDRRMNEFGVRLALGAQPKDLHRLVMKRGLMAATSGVLFGIVGALALTQFMQSLLFDTVPYDPLVYAAVALILLLAAVAACWLPARRAGRVDITRLLRAE